MTNAKHIAIARLHLANNNKEAYLRQMTAGIRASMSTRSSNAYIKAMLEDGFKYNN